MREDSRKLSEWHKRQLEINFIGWKINEWLTMNISIIENLEGILDKVEKENGHIVFVFEEPENFSRFIKKIREKKLYKYFPDNYALLKWNIENEVRAEIVPISKAESFVETATHYMYAEMYDKNDFENKENMYEIDGEE